MLNATEYKAYDYGMDWKWVINMKSIEELRKELHSAMQLGNKEEILRVSQELDIAILDFLKESKGQVVANESVYNSK